MKTLVLFAIALGSGAIGGAFLGLLNQLLTEPYIDSAVNIEAQRNAAAGQAVDPYALAHYRAWQRGGAIVSDCVLGTSLGALFGLVFSLTRNGVPGRSNVMKALFLAGVIWFVLFMSTALKYPPNPPGIGEQDTYAYRQTLYVTFVAVSGLSAIGAAFAYRQMAKSTPANKRAVIAVAIYAGAMGAAYVALPFSPDPVTMPVDLVAGFRIVSVVSMALFWAVMAIVFGVLWNRLKPHEEQEWRVKPL